MPKGIKKRKPWHKLPQEGPKAHELFMVFVSLGAGRKVNMVAEQTGRKTELCYSLSGLYNWVSRAAAYDNWMLQVQEKSVEQQLQRDGVLFAQRRSIFRNREYTLAQKLLDQADEMLAVPLFQDQITKTIVVNTLEHPEGQEIPVEIIRTPTKWTKRDALHYAKTAVEIMRLHLDMETQKIGVNVDLKDPNVRLQMAQKSLQKWRDNVGQLVDEEMARNPNLDRNLVTIAILEKLPQWAAADWRLEANQIPLLTEGDEALPLSLNDISLPETVN
jgi:hypothetical protein